MVEVEINVHHILEVDWDVDRAMELVADVPLSASHFPGLQRLDDLGDGVYRWNMKPFDVGPIHHQVRYSARYMSDMVARTVVWSTVGTDGNTRADGVWRVSPAGEGARLIFENRLSVQLPVPRLVGRMAKKAVPRIMDKQTRRYLERLAQKMDGRLVS